MENGEKLYLRINVEGPPIDWESQGDALVEYIRQEMAVHVTLARWIAPGRELEADADPFLSNGWCLYSDALQSRLIFAFLVDGIAVFIETSGEWQSGDQLEAWKSAYGAAYLRLFQDEPEFRWIAAIGQIGSDVGDTPKITQGAAIKNIEILPARNPYTEGINLLTNPSLGGVTIYSSFPLVIRGRAPGHNWEAASRRAAQEANTICALLSLEFDCYWAIRSQPFPLRATDNDELNLPSWGYGLSPDDHHGHVLGSKREVSIPSWAQVASERVSAEPILYSALHAHRQGLALQVEHPSLALICFVSAIEGVGAMFEELSECEHCNMKKGARRRFRRALKTVFTNKDMAGLITAYDLRSQTAHSGILHGEETRMGNMRVPGDIFYPALDYNFRYKVVWSMRKASKKVLMKQLSE